MTSTTEHEPRPPSTGRPRAVFDMIGGWTAIAESVASRVVFLIAYLLSADVVVSALIAVGAVVVIAVARLRVDHRPWPVLFALATIAVSAFLAGHSGQAADFYLPRVIAQPVLGAVVLVSMLAGRPLVGVVVETLRARHARDRRRGWRHDPVRRRRYQQSSAVFLAKDALATALLVPLYLSQALLPLGITVIVLGGPLAGGACAYLCWRIVQRPSATLTTGMQVPA